MAATISLTRAPAFCQSSAIPAYVINDASHVPAQTLPGLGACSSRWLRSGLFCAVTLAFWLVSVNLPGPAVAGLESWHTILVDARLNDRQFGPEIVFTYGPWSFLGLSGYLPEALGERFVWEILGKLLLSVTIVLASASLPGLRRCVFLAAFACGAAYFDNMGEVVVALLTFLWLMPRRARWWQRLLALGWFSFLAHFKFVFCMQAVAGVVLAAFIACLERRFRTAVAMMGVFLVGYVACWRLSGQSVANLPEYLRLNVEISRGYSWAMGLEPTAWALVCGGLTVLLCMGCLVLLWRSDLPQTERLGLCLVAGVNWFVAWKQGFVRADGHVFAFFYFCLFFGFAIASVAPPRRWLWWMGLNAAMCLGGIVISGSSLLTYGPCAAWDHLRRFPYELTHLAGWTQRFVAAHQRAALAVDDPGLKALVGDRTVDLLTYEQGLLLLNGLNYRPRPVAQSYTAYTEGLLEANGRHFRSDRAPDFVVLRLKSIDGRYPGQEDSLALAELVRRYEVVRLDSDSGVFRRKWEASAVPALRRETLGEQVAGFGEDLRVPDGRKGAVWMELDLVPTLLGRLRALLYHASPPSMVATFPDGRRERFRTVPGANAAGFLLRPFVESHADLAAFMRGSPVIGPQTIRVDLGRANDRLYWENVHVRFLALPDLTNGSVK